jgi:class 3 adenylate cyclase
MSSQTNGLPSRLTETRATLVHIDISRATSIIMAIGDEIKIVLFIDGFYELCSNHIEKHGGEVIKYMGDSCLAMFGEDECLNAINAVTGVRDDFAGYCKERDVKATDIHASIHVGETIVGGFGPQQIRDVLGKAPGALFLMTNPGITISEQVYRKLSSDKRTSWRKQGGNVYYVLK